MSEISTDGASGGIEKLVVFDSLEVGPIKLEPRRVITSYEIIY